MHVEGDCLIPTQPTDVKKANEANQTSFRGKGKPKWYAMVTSPLLKLDKGRVKTKIRHFSILK